MTSELHEAIALPSFDLNSDGLPGGDAIAAYERDGVVSLKGAFESRWIDMLAEGMEIAIRDGVDRDTEFNIANPGEPGFFYYDTFMWQRIDQFKRFAMESRAADMARRVMRSETLLFYFDFMLVKEPGTSRETPWHYDEAYWPVSGDQACNLWTALDPIPEATALRFVLGSHRWPKNYRAVHFDPAMAYADPSDEPEPPDWWTMPGNFDIAYTPMEPGDCLIFHNRSHHSAPGNSLEATRRRALSTCWLGDDITYNNKSQETDPPNRGEGLVHGGSMECTSFPKVR
jgi:ectoine hydroxylase-related dioxygenase (phytanoyl-CoA dioxygenase family)